MSHLFSRRYGLLVVLFLLMLAIPLAVSEAGSGTVQGPTLVSPDVQWIVTTTSMGSSEHDVCLWYQPTAPAGAAATQACTCSGGTCPVGQWTCSVPSANLQGKTVSWQARTYSNSGCSSEKGQIGTPTSTQFGPNAVTLGALSAQGLPAPFGLILSVAGLAVIGGVALRRSRRS